MSSTTNKTELLESGSGALSKTWAHFARPSGKNLLERTERYYRWLSKRLEFDVWDYSKCLNGPALPIAEVANQQGENAKGINFASQDYLSLSSHPAVVEAALRAIRDLGLHSAGSAFLLGNTSSSLKLESIISQFLLMEHVVLFPTGWGAGYGTIKALVRADDHIVIDELSHSCLQEGAFAATRNVRRHAHMDVESARQILQEIRDQDTRNAILVVTEGLFSMDADGGDVVALQKLCHEYEATLLVDVAHDLGAMGPEGKGQLGAQEMLGKVDLVMGAFSKTFASNGGFLATHSPAVKQFVKAQGSPHIFSNALSPVQTEIVSECFSIVSSNEGRKLREAVLSVATAVREGLSQQNIRCLGSVSPIVPVFVGQEKIARLAVVVK